MCLEQRLLAFTKRLNQADKLLLGKITDVLHLLKITKPESTEGRPWGQPLKKPAGAPLNLG